MQPSAAKPKRFSKPEAYSGLNFSHCCSVLLDKANKKSSFKLEKMGLEMKLASFFQSNCQTVLIQFKQFFMFTFFYETNIYYFLHG